MIKTILGLGLALLISVGFNLYQWRGAAVTRAEHQAAIDAAVARGHREAAELAASRNAGIALLRTIDDAKLLELRQQVVTREVETRLVYQERIRFVDRPSCPASPGQVAAVNEVLR